MLYCIQLPGTLSDTVQCYVYGVYILTSHPLEELVLVWSQDT